MTKAEQTAMAAANELYRFNREQAIWWFRHRDRWQDELGGRAEAIRRGHQHKRIMRSALRLVLIYANKAK